MLQKTFRILNLVVILSLFIQPVGLNLHINHQGNSDNEVLNDDYKGSGVSPQALDNGLTDRISFGYDGISQSNNESGYYLCCGGYGVAISGDGRYVAFESKASNLVPNDTNGYSDIFVYDKQTKITKRVSVSSTGEEANGGSYWVSISNDGSRIAFTSAASNLVDGDTNNALDVFVYDMNTGHTIRVSVKSDGSQVYEGSSASYPSISGDGDSVSFTSNAEFDGTNLINSVIVHKISTGETKNIVMSSDGVYGNKGGGGSSHSPFSYDGRYIAFVSGSDNLVPDDTNNTSDIFVRDLLLGKTTRVSVTSGGKEGANSSDSPSISGDGQYVVFSTGSALISCTTQCPNIFLHDMLTGVTSPVDIPFQDIGPNGVSYNPSISSNGRFVSFQSDATNLVPNDLNTCPSSPTYCLDIFVRNLLLNQNFLISVDSNNNQTNDSSFDPAISSDGRYVAFESLATNLVPDDTNGFSDIFLRDRGDQNYSISGKIIDASNLNNPIPGVTIPAIVGNPPKLITSTVTGNDGKYTINSLQQGTYTLTPYKAGYLFDPPIVNIDPSIKSSQDFTGTQAGKKPWLLMYYLAGDNDLEDSAINQLNKLENYTNQPAFNIAVMFDGAKAGDSMFYYIKDNVTSVKKNELDSGDSATLSEFVKWARSMYPADHTALILYDHGSLDRAMQDNHDGTSSKSLISVKDLGNTLKILTSQGGKFDLLYFETCLLGSIEDAYQFRGVADYYIASENLAYLNDKDNVDYLKALTEATSPSNLAIIMAKGYETSVNTKIPYTISVSQMANLSTLVDKVSNLAGLINYHLTYSPLDTTATILQTQILNNVQRFDSNSAKKSDFSSDCNIDTNDGSIDLYDFARLVKLYISDSSMQNAAQEVMNAIQDNPDPSSRYILYNGNTKTPGAVADDVKPKQCAGKRWDLSNSHGVSIFYNNSNTKTSWYNGDNLDFALGTDWSLIFPARANKNISMPVDTINWGPMLVSYINIINPNAPIDPALPPMGMALTDLPRIYLPFIR